MGSSSAPSERTTTFTTPTLQSLKELEGTEAPPTFQSVLPANTPQIIRSVVLLLGAATSAAVASGGIAVLCYLLATHSLTPPQLRYSTPLQLDLSGRDLVSSASMLPHSKTSPSSSSPSPAGSSKVDSEARFLLPGQHMDVWVDLMVPGRGMGAGELAHVVADLESNDGRVAGRATQPILLKGRSFSVWSVLSAPLRWLGLFDDVNIISLKLFSDYVERRDIPFTSLKLTIKPRSDTGPNVLSATARVHLNVGIFRRVLYHLRPHSLLALALSAGAVCAAFGGSFGVVLSLGLLAYTLMTWGGGGEEAVRGGTDSDSASDLLEGVSTPGTTPRDIDFSSEDEENEGEVQVVVPSRGDQRPWQELLEQLPVPKGGGGGGVGDDSAYFLNKEGGGGGGRKEISGGGLRWRS